jgi:O-antigen ligase
MISQKKNELILAITLNVIVMLVLIKQEFLSLTLPFLVFCNIVAFIQKNKPFAKLMNNRFWIMSMLLPLFFLIGSLNTINLGKAWFEIIQKLSIPVIGFLIVWPVSDFSHFFTNMRKYYLVSVSLCVLVSLFFATKLFLKTNSYEAFLYTNFSGSNHPSYYAMFLCMALIISVENFIKPDFFHKNTVLKSILLIIPFIGIIVLSSKSGLIAMIAIMLFYGFRISLIKMKESKNAFKIKLLFWSFTLLSSFFILKSDRFYVASLGLKEIHEKPFDELGTAGQRILIWESVLEISKNKWLIGTGVGKDQDALNDKYRQKKLSPFYEKSLNAHNQFLQALLILGICGFVFFIIYLAYPLFVGWKLNDPYLICFGIIIFINALTESILNRQVGVIFWTLWSFILLVARNFKNEIETPLTAKTI